MESTPIKAAFEELTRASEDTFQETLDHLLKVFRQNIPLERNGESEEDVRSAFNQLLHGVAKENDPHRWMCRAAAFHAIARSRIFDSSPGDWPRFWRNLNDDAQGWCKRILLKEVSISGLSPAAVKDIMAAKGYASCLAEDFKPSDLPIPGYELDMGLLGSRGD